MQFFDFYFIHFCLLDIATSEDSLEPASQLSENNCFGREDEIEKLKSFCDESWTGSRLCMVSGSPGNGKSGTTMAALNSVHKSKLVIPKFNQSGVNGMTTFERFLSIVKDSWRSTVDPELLEDADIEAAMLKGTTGYHL